jgi:hypothetical protein
MMYRPKCCTLRSPLNDPEAIHDQMFDRALRAKSEKAFHTSGQRLSAGLSIVHILRAIEMDVVRQAYDGG